MKAKLNFQKDDSYWSGVNLPGEDKKKKARSEKCRIQQCYGQGNSIQRMFNNKDAITT